jgi:DNA-binding response OmpR family regulator
VIGLEMGADDYLANRSIRVNCWRGYALLRRQDKLRTQVASDCGLMVGGCCPNSVACWRRTERAGAEPW